MSCEKTEEYMRLIADFVGGSIAAQEFERRYLTLFKSDQGTRDEVVFKILYKLFTDVDAYCADPELRDAEDLDEEGLKSNAAKVLQELRELTPKLEVVETQAVKRIVSSKTTGSLIRGLRFSISGKQVQKKFKFARFFEVEGEFNSVNAARFESALLAHISNPDNLVIEGTFRGYPGSFILDPNAKNCVALDEFGNFMSGWKLTGDQYIHLLQFSKIG